MSYIVCLWSRFLGKQVSNMSARRVRGTSEDYGTITAIAIDKDKNSQHALKWAVENIVEDSPQCVLLHVQRRHLSSSSFETTIKRTLTIWICYAVGNTSQHDNQDEAAQQFFLPFRGFCARKGVSDLSFPISILATTYISVLIHHISWHYCIYTNFSDHSEGGYSSWYWYLQCYC